MLVTGLESSISGELVRIPLQMCGHFIRDAVCVAFGGKKMISYSVFIIVNSEK